MHVVFVHREFYRAKVCPFELGCVRGDDDDDNCCHYDYTYDSHYDSQHGCYLDFWKRNRKHMPSLFRHVWDSQLDRSIYRILPILDESERD